MPPPQPSYTKVTYKATYPAIEPTLPALSTAGKVVVITGASGGIGQATAVSFAASGSKALILLGRRPAALAETAAQVRATNADVPTQTHTVDLCDAPATRGVMDAVVREHGGIDVFVHCAGVLAPVQPLLTAHPATFLDGYKTTVVGTLSPDVTFVNLTTAGILFPAFPGMGAYVSSKMAAVKLLEAFAAENPGVRLHNVHPGFLKTDMSAQLAKTTQLPFEYDDLSLPSNFLVWIVSPEAHFLRNKLVFAAWDVEELKARKAEIVGSSERPGSCELWFGFKGFPRYVGGNPLPGTLPPGADSSKSEERPPAKRSHS
ncbi:cellulase signal transduction associated dehydrogenase [Hypoxylon sp. FL1150]|nr:cellulase signal transduction associated dehydrogenase [Hypoxylon sp. FL1150]